MKKSPLNFLGLAQIASGLSDRLTGGGGIFGAVNAGNNPSRRKKYFGGRLNRLERDVKVLMDERKKTRDDYIGEGQSVLGAPTIDDTMPAQSEQLLPPPPTLASRAMMEGMTGAPSFNLGKGQEMFGDSIPGSFDRDMGV